MNLCVQIFLLRFHLQKNIFCETHNAEQHRRPSITKNICLISILHADIYRIFNVTFKTAYNRVPSIIKVNLAAFTELRLLRIIGA